MKHSIISTTLSIILLLGSFWVHFFDREKASFLFRPIFEQSKQFQVIAGEIKDLESLMARFSAQLTKIPLLPNPETTTTIEDPQTGQTQPPQNQRTALTVANILFFTNQERIALGLDPLRSESLLNASAAKKSQDMFNFDYFAHQSPIKEDRDFAYFINNEGYDFIRISENLAMGDFTTAQDVVDAWMDSKNHRANIVYSDYQDIGVSVQKGYLNGAYTTIIVQHFGIPKNACSLKGKNALADLRDIEYEALILKNKAMELEAKINIEESQMTEGELNSIIDLYNTTIRTYNRMVQEFQEITEVYNKEIADYNKCVQELNNA